VKSEKIETEDSYMTDLRYPIGQFQFPEVVTAQQVQEWMEDIRLLPTQLAQALSRASSKH